MAPVVLFGFRSDVDCGLPRPRFRPKVDVSGVKWVGVSTAAEWRCGWSSGGSARAIVGTGSGSPFHFCAMQPRTKAPTDPLPPVSHRPDRGASVRVRKRRSVSVAVAACGVALLATFLTGLVWAVGRLVTATPFQQPVTHAPVKGSGGSAVHDGTEAVGRDGLRAVLRGALVGLGAKLPAGDGSVVAVPVSGAAHCPCPLCCSRCPRGPAHARPRDAA